MKTTTHNSSFILHSRHGRGRSSSVFLPAFSIVEVMFAVMILGIGFILVAAMFPVAIQQTQATVDDTRGRLAAQNGVAAFAMAFRDLTAAEQTACNTGTAYVGNLNGAPATFRQVYQSLQIDPENPRYAWTAMYRYTTGSTTLDIFPVALIATETPEFAQADVANLAAQNVPVVVPTVTPGNPPRIRFTNAVGQAIAVEGALIFDATNGKPYRLGNPVDGTIDTWELVGNTAPPSSVTTVFILGRCYNGAVATGPNQVRYAPDLPITVSINQ